VSAVDRMDRFVEGRRGEGGGIWRGWIIRGMRFGESGSLWEGGIRFSLMCCLFLESSSM
jgi:hypothetical protein